MGEHQGGDGYLNAEGLASGLLGDPVAIYPYQRKELALVWLGETLLCQCLVCSLSPAHACHRSLCWVCLPSPHGWCCGCLLQNVIAEHEIRNISCAAQDPEDLCTFAYITKDLQTSHHYCHVFSTVDVVSRGGASGLAASLGARAQPRGLSSCQGLRCPACLGLQGVEVFPRSSERAGRTGACPVCGARSLSISLQATSECPEVLPGGLLQSERSDR